MFVNYRKNGFLSSHRHMECIELKMFLLRVKMIITSEIHRHGRKDVVALTEGGFDYDRCMLRSWPMRASVKK